MKDSFILHTDAWAAIRKLTMEQRGMLLSAIMQRQIGEETDELDMATEIAFSFIMAQIDRDNEKYSQMVEKRKAAANQRWQKGQENMQVHASASTCSTRNAHACLTDTDTDTDTVFHNRGFKGGVDAPATTKKLPSVFRKPTVEEVREYCESRDNGIDAEAFIDYYEANGWKVGRNSMKDWKATVRTWERKEKPRSGTKTAFDDFDRYVEGGKT